MLNTGNSWQDSLVRSAVISAAAALFFSSTGFADDDGAHKESEKREIGMSVKIPAMPVPTTLVEAVKTIPPKVSFAFQEEQPWFKTTEPLIIPQAIKNKIKIVIEENNGLSASSEEGGVTLLPFIKVGDGQEFSKEGDSVYLNERAAMAEPIVFGISDVGEDRPPEGDYEGKMVLLFEEAI